MSEQLTLGEVMAPDHDFFKVVTCSVLSVFLEGNKLNSIVKIVRDRFKAVGCILDDDGLDLTEWDIEYVEDPLSRGDVFYITAKAPADRGTAGRCYEKEMAKVWERKEAAFMRGYKEGVEDHGYRAEGGIGPRLPRSE